MRVLHVVIVVVVVAPLALAHVLDSQIKIPTSSGKNLGAFRSDAPTHAPPIPFDDKFFLNWLQNILGYKPAIATTTTTQSPTNEPETQICGNCKCGLTNKKHRIVGGHETEVNEYPWMALLMYRGRFYCGGTVINNKYVLTAAHCVDRFQKQLITVRILEHDRNSTTESDARDFKVSEIIKHTGYSTTNYNNDIALIKIDGEIEFDDQMKPVCLAEKSKTFSGETGIATGWGATKESGPISTTLREVAVPILSNIECRNSKYPSRKITDNMLCAGYKQGAKDSCQGDSGGPLHVKVAEKIHRIVGIVSWGEGCAQPGFPGVYTRVNRFTTWIHSNTEDACYCSDEPVLRLRSS